MKKRLTLSLCLILAACSPVELYQNRFVQEAQVTDTTRAGQLLVKLPTPSRQIPIAVYDFQDQTGQFKYNDQFTDYSSAVTKGGVSVLVKALLDTGNGKWFLVAERNGLNNLLKERQIIRTMRSEYTRPDGSKLPDLPPMIYGGMMLEGGIVFYDSNILTGGAAAGYFGISGSTQYRRDIVTVYLRGIDINNGQVVLAVNSSKTVFSYAVSGSVLRYLAFDKLLEAETGFSVNEPSQLAVRQAIETALYSLVMEGSLRGMWGFADPVAGKKAQAEYLERRDGGGKINPFADDNATPVKQATIAAPASAAVPAVVRAEPAPAPAAAAVPEPKKPGTSWFSDIFGSDSDEAKIVPQPQPEPQPQRKPLPRSQRYEAPRPVTMY